jgi:hypothetical protein
MMQPMRFARFATCLVDALFPDAGRATEVIVATKPNTDRAA